MEILVDKKTGLNYRPGTSDKKMLRESFNDYKTVVLTDKIVMDLGANIGGFTYNALSQGAKQVISFEPDQANFDMLSMNISDPRALLNRAAVIASDDPTITFYTNGTANSACSGSIFKKRGGSSVTVPAVNFETMLNTYRPSMVKMDVEGAEYDLLANGLPDFVDELAIELHGFRLDQAPKMDEMYKKLCSEWTLVHSFEQKVFNIRRIIVGHFKR